MNEGAVFHLIPNSKTNRTESTDPSPLENEKGEGKGRELEKAPERGESTGVCTGGRGVIS